MNWNTLHCHPNCDGPYPCLVAPIYCELYATPEQCCEDNNQDADCAKVLSPPLPVEDCPVEGQCPDPDGECKTQVTCLADPCGEQTECSPSDCTANYCGRCHHVCSHPSESSSNLYRDDRRELNFFVPDSTSTSCSENEKSFVVDVVTDVLPTPVSWILANTCTGFDMMNSIPSDTLYTFPLTSYSISWCVPSNAYNFTIVGAVESYAITYDGETFAEGGGLLLLT